MLNSPFIFGLRYALLNVGLRLLPVQIGSKQIQGYECPVSWRCDLCPCNTVQGTSLGHAAGPRSGVLWAFFGEGDLFVQCWKNHNPNAGSDRWFWVAAELGRCPWREPRLISGECVACGLPWHYMDRVFWLLTMRCTGCSATISRLKVVRSPDGWGLCLCSRWTSCLFD